MSAVDEVFSQLKASGKKAFMPFITAGDPNLHFTAECIKALDSAGADLIELGIPYSDPIADGPTIQASYTRALDGGVRNEAIFEMVTKVVSQINTPIVSMVSYAIIFRMGLDTFLEQAKQAGFAGAIVPDMPVDESEKFAAKCEAADFSLIQLITPTTSQARAAEIARKSTGFIYYVSVTGITGERTQLPDDLVDNLRELRGMTETPVCVGFGISQPAHIEMLAPVADGVIVGSAIVKRMAQVKDDATSRVALDEISQFATELVRATNP